MGKRFVLIALLVVGLAAAGYVAVQRHRLESLNRAVEIVVDWDEVQQVAAATGTSPVDVLKRFKSAGVTSVAITEETLKDAIDSGRASARADGGIRLDRATSTNIAGYVGSIVPSVGSALQSMSVRPPVALPTYGMSLAYLEQLPTGLPKDALTSTREAGLEIVARLVSYPGATPQAINFMMADAKRQGAKTIVFSGDTVLGFKGAVETTADAFRANDLYFGRVEFSKQKGDENLAEKAKDRLVVVHSITQAEMPGLSEPSVVDRFQKGVRERGVRMCYIRMYYTAGDDLVGSNADYIHSISKSITKAGYTLTNVHLLGEVQAPVVARVLAAIGVAAGILLLIGSIVETPGIVLSVLIVLACAGLAAFGEMGRKAVALLSALSFPTLAVLRATSNTPVSPTVARNVPWRAIGRLACAVVTVAIGGLLIVGLLSQRDFMLRTDQFMGVKVAHLLPVLTLAILYAGGIAWKSDKWADQRRRFWKSVRNIGSNPLLIWQAAGMLAAVMIVGLMVLRSGNDSGVGVSGLELKFRSILDKVLYVRPRTKEFLIGYPALLAGIAFALRGRRQYAAPLVVIGSVGLVSALNTFCHIHTPIQLSLIRVLNGAVVGVLAGVVVYSVIKKLPGEEQ